MHHVVIVSLPDRCVMEGLQILKVMDRSVRVHYEAERLAKKLSARQGLDVSKTMLQIVVVRRIESEEDFRSLLLTDRDERRERVERYRHLSRTAWKKLLYGLRKRVVGRTNA